MTDKKLEDFLNKEGEAVLEKVKEALAARSGIPTPLNFLISIIHKIRNKQQLDRLEEIMLIELFNSLTVVVKEERVEIEYYTTDEFGEMNIINATDFSEVSDWALSIFKSLKEAYCRTVFSLVSANRHKELIQYSIPINTFRLNGNIVRRNDFLNFLEYIYYALYLSS